MMQSPGGQFLHERNPNLHFSQQVEGVVDFLRANGKSIPNEPANKISAYLGFLADKEYVNDGVLTGDTASIDRQISAQVIDPKSVPKGYFELQRRIAREDGHGDIDIPTEVQAEEMRIANANQRHGLNTWVEYMSEKDSVYPDWFKLYAFDNLVKMGNFDKQKGEYQKRTQHTTAPFPELTRGALSQVYSWIKEAKIDGKTVRDVFDNPTQEIGFQNALKSGNFSKLYVHAIQKTQEGMITPEQKKETRGSWKLYMQNSDPAVLHANLQGFGLDWCTATGFETTVLHLNVGDFYVYHSRDNDGYDTVPRIAIRMQEGRVAEVRGVNPSQELEPEMADITVEQVKDLPGGESYLQKAQDMKRLTAIENKTTADPACDLTDNEIRFLYEVDRDIQGFGFDRDPRIKEIRNMRTGRDRLKLHRIVPESILNQLTAASIAFTIVEYELQRNKQKHSDNEATTRIQELGELFAIKDREWKKSGVYEFLVEELITHGNRYTLVATPDIQASEKQLVRLAEAYGEKQPHGTYVNDELYRKGKFSGRELSGVSVDTIARLSLIPARFDKALSFKLVIDQVSMLRQRQQNSPNLNCHVPSLLEAITYWYTMRAHCDFLDDSGALEKTYIRHFDLEPKVVDGWLHVPGSCVDDDGEPGLSGSGTGSDYEARIAVG